MPRITDKGDVRWYAPKRKKPIVWSTHAVANLIYVLADDDDTVQSLRNKFGKDFISDPEVENILDSYIRYGHGNLVLKKTFHYLG